jgi:type 1 glutamine amidotransferase
MSSVNDRIASAFSVVLALLALSLSERAFAANGLERPPTDALRALIVTGQGDHDWRKTTPFLRQVLGDSGRFDVRVCEAPTALTARLLADFDVLINDFGTPASGSDAEKAILGFIESGKGVVVTQGALRSWPPPGIVGAKERDHPADGRDSTGATDALWPASRSGTGATGARFVDVQITRPEHPIVHGFKTPFRIADAVGLGMSIHPGAEVIATASDIATSPERAGEPVLIASSHGNGRIFVCALGHDLAAMHEPEFIAAFARGAEWAATGRVTLPADLRLALARPRPGAVRGLVITGGHDHETSFYSIFDGYHDLAGMPVASSSTAFENDLRARYDVVIMYDFSRDLNERGKKNLRAFVESGKGIVVLHHALLDYQNWPWWYEDVVGGRYRLKSEGGAPSSTVKDSQQLFVTPEGTHPITANVGQFHIIDETYKRMWISPKVRPLLSTDNPNSDKFVAWVGPCASSRVVAIQLGHGPTAFGHPDYRKLVHNAILWTAGRLK